MRDAIDPRWPGEMRAARQRLGLTFRQLATCTSYSHTYLWELETGRKQPNTAAAIRIDEALQADGRLAALVVDTTVPASPDDLDRLALAAAKPRTVDLAAVDSLRAILAHQRRLEDTIGSAPLIAPVQAQLAVIENLLIDARGTVRPAVVDVAAQWGQFAGWLHAAAGRSGGARDWYARTLEWAAEVSNVDMIATALNMRGHLAWLAGEPGPVIGLSAAAGRQPAAPGVRALAAQHEARGHALVGDADEMESRLDRAAVLAAEAAEHPEREPPWVYFYNGHYLAMQRGLAYRLLGRDVAAIEELQDGLAAMPDEVRRSEWVGAYVLHLAAAHEAAGNRDVAIRALEEARAIATVTGAARLTQQVERLSRRLGL
jgi:transcriptional regulator with XRE-family HTH domain